MEILQVSSVAYFRLSEIFVNVRDQRLEGILYPVEKENVGCWKPKRHAIALRPVSLARCGKAEDGSGYRGVCTALQSLLRQGC
jgi:hypothetical protein